MSLLPLSTVWMAVSKLAPQPVAFYPASNVTPRERKFMRFRSVITLCVFAAAAVMALKFPLAGLGLCCCRLIVYLKPEAPGAGKPQAPPAK